MAQAPAVQDRVVKQQSEVEQLVTSKAYLDDPEVLPWYNKNLTELKPETRAVFEQYSKIPSADVVPHIKHVRDEAFRIYPYACLGHWGFLDLSVGQSPAYDEVLGRVKNGAQLLDIGCCMGQDIRKLAHDGAPTENMHAADLKKDFWDFGYDLFLDKTTLKTEFIEADIFNADSKLKELDGKIEIVSAASFFHLFDWKDQVRAAKRVVQLLKPESGSLIIGRQGGMPEAGNMGRLTKEIDSFWHNPESFAKMWKQVGEETRSEWKVEAAFGGEDLWEKMKVDVIPRGTRFLTFTVRRV